MTVQVPSIYQQYVAQAAQDTGLPQSVVAAQIDYESSFNPNAVSPTGAQGIAQFEPGTWSSYGVGSPFDPKAAFAAYAKYMKTLLDQFHGNVTDALEAYNAGPGNLQAGAGYAQHILSVAGQPGGIQLTDSGGANLGTNAQTTGWQDDLHNMFGWLTRDPITQLLGNGGLAGSLASGLEQGIMRGFLDVLIAFWQKIIKPVFWVFEISGGIVIMLVSLAILTQNSGVGGKLSDITGMLPGPWGAVARGSSQLMRGQRPAGALGLRGGGAPQQESAPAPAAPRRGNNQYKRRVYSGGESETKSEPKAAVRPATRTVARSGRRPASTKKPALYQKGSVESYEETS